MKMNAFLGLFAVVALSVTVSGNAQETKPPTEHPGKAVYEKACASCHDHPDTSRAPTLQTLQAMGYQAVNYALTLGKMQAMAATLSNDERSAVTDYLTGRELATGDWTAAHMCTGNRKKVDLRATPIISGFGFDMKNHRALTAAQTGLHTKDFANLELAWSLGFPKATTMRAQPAIVGTTLFLPVADAQAMYALDIAGPPCVKWIYKTAAPLRTSAAYGELPGSKRKVVVFADIGTNVHMLDAATGELIWTQNVGLYQWSIATGTPVIYKDRVFVPISQYEITIGGDPKHLCCTTHGAVTALDAATGAKIWTAHTMAEAKPVRDRGDGQMIWGPSGAPIWNSPSIDEKRGVLYVGTGEATSEPADENTDSILAIDMKTGAIRWHFQATANDIFVGSCARTPGPNCPKSSVYRDVDFGASTVLAKRSNGKDILLAGQKAGTLWAFDPDQNGKVLWRQDFGEGSPLGGIHWGIATDGERVFAPINRPYGFSPGKQDPTQKPGLHAVKIDTGEVLWTFIAEPDCSGDREKRIRNCQTNIGLSAAPAVIDGAVVTGSVDGILRVFDAKTGAVLFTYNTARSFDTVNGVEGSGGAIDAASISAANGYLFVSSGYGMFGQTAGNVLLAFKPKDKK
jgi:polyvinyl alcohol dehydrogenase (cytochrome)